MALPFSSLSTVRTVCCKPTSMLSIRDGCCRLHNGNVMAWKSSGNYVAVRVGVGSITRNFSSVEQSRGVRRATLRCATIDEIAAQKSLVESDVKDRMQKAIESLLTNFNSIRTGRANPSMLDRVVVEYYGTPVSLKSIAQISTPDSNSFLVQPYDKSSLKIIEKAIVSSDIGLTPSNDGDVIRLSLPLLTSDRRKELSKVVAKQAEEGKVALRNIRRDGLKAYEKLEKEKKLSEDNVKDFSSDLQKLVDEYMKKVESLSKQKEKEVLTV